MSLHPPNPFANFGKIVKGSNFIGRRDALRAIESRVIDPGEGGSLAVIGIYRIGKSSLAYQALIARKSELHKKKFLPIWINLAKYDEPLAFFRDLVDHCRKELRELKWENDAMRSTANKALKHDLTWNESRTRIERFFTRVHRAGIRVIFVLDEFDHARALFKNDIPRIQGFRDLAIYPEWQVSWVVTSRHSIYDIETKAIGISNLQGIFLEAHLSMFEEEDMPSYFQRLAEAKLTITQAHKDMIDAYCGKHPYLLALMGYQLVEMYGREESDINVAAAFHKIEQQFKSYYDKVTDLLRENKEEMLKKLRQILFGPSYGLEQTDIDDMIRYGLIRPNPAWTSEHNGTAAYVAFSQHFQEYLSSQIRDTELWPLLADSERELRRVIRSLLGKNHSSGEYGEHCLTTLEKADPNLKVTIDNCRKLQQKDKNTWGAASADLLDYTYPRDLFTIIFADWRLFQPIFGKQKRKDKGYWNNCGEILTKMRNALAHHRIDNVTKSHYVEAERFCEELLAIAKTVE